MEETEGTRAHEERFRCPECGRLVTVTARYRRNAAGVDAMVHFDCTMEGMCGSPIWDPCPMYLAFMEQSARQEAAGPRTGGFGQRASKTPPA